MGEISSYNKKITKQLTGKRDDTELHTAARSGNLQAVQKILSSPAAEVKQLLEKQNQSGETPLYAASENGQADVVRELINHYDLADAGIKARNGFDAFHIAAKEGNIGQSKAIAYLPTSLLLNLPCLAAEILKILFDAHPELAMTVDSTNTTALHTAATQGHAVIVEFLLEAAQSLVTIARSNGKTALHSSARNGHLEVVKLVLSAEPGITARIDKKRQTALHMAAKGQSTVVVEELITADPSTINIVDSKGNTALHIASRKGREEIVRLLLRHEATDLKAVNRSGETALDTAEKTSQAEIAAILEARGVPPARELKPQNPARELKQTVSDIKHEVHYQLEHAKQTRRRVQGIAKRLNKMHAEGLNNAINSTTVVAVLIATVAFAAIFTVPGQYVDDVGNVPAGQSLGEANIARKVPFIIFFVFDSIALFISLAVVVVQTSVVVIESKAKKQMMAVINKLMWIACVLISVAFLALSFIVVGEKEKWLAIGVTIVGASIMVTTLGTMSYWVVKHRIEASTMRSIRRASMGSRSRSFSGSAASDNEFINKEFKKMYAI